MPETLGEALLILRTDDRGLDAGIDRARPKAEALGRSLDATTGSASKLAKTMADASGQASQLGDSQSKLAQTAGEVGKALGVTSDKGNELAGTIGDTMSGALSVAGAEGSKFASVLAGPVGVALSQVVPFISGFVAGLFESSEAADKAGSAGETFADSLDRQKHSLTEVVTAIRAYNLEQEKSRESTLDNAIAAAARADAVLKEAIAERKKLAALLEGRIASAQANAGQGTGGAAGQVAQAQLEAARSALKANEEAIGNYTKDAEAARANFADELSKIATDPTLAIKRHFKQLRDDASETIKDVGRLTEKLADLRRQEDAALDIARKAGRSTRTATPTPSASADASIGDMVALVGQLFPGATITSTTGGKHTKGSDHYAGRAIDFVPGGGMGTYTTAEVEKILEDAGVTIRRNAGGTKQIFGPGRSASKPGDHDDHFHIAWQGGASPEEADRRSKAAAERVAREREKEAARVERYNRNLASLENAAADLQDRMADTAEERYQLEVRGLEIANAEQARRITANADYTAAEKATLLAALAKKAALERELLDRRRQEELARQQLEVAQAVRVNDRDLLQAQLRLADTREQRRDIELRLLDLTYEQEKAALDAVLASRESTDAQKQIARARLAVLGQLKAGDSQAIEREYESPLDRYRRELTGVSSNINDELEKVAVSGLDNLNDRLTDVIMKTKSLGAAFKDVASQIIADLIRIAVQKYITAPLADMLFGGGGGGGFGGGIPGLGSLLGFAGLFADGGLIPNGSFGIVGEAGPEPIFATAGGVGVLPNSALRTATASRGPEKIDLHVTVSGARGNAEIETMVARGVKQGLASYDAVVADRVEDQLARRK